MCGLIPGLAERVEVIGATTRFDSVTVPSPAFAISRYAHVAFKNLCESMAERAVPDLEPMTDQPVYLSRAGLDSKKKRMLVGEDRLELCLEKQGFRKAQMSNVEVAVDTNAHVDVKLEIGQVQEVVQVQTNVSQLQTENQVSGTEQSYGRGIVLMRSIMDDVTYNTAGNEVTLVKRCVTMDDDECDD